MVNYTTKISKFQMEKSKYYRKLRQDTEILESVVLMPLDENAKFRYIESMVINNKEETPNFKFFSSHKTEADYEIFK